MSKQSGLTKGETKPAIYQAIRSGVGLLLLGIVLAVEWYVYGIVGAMGAAPARGITLFFSQALLVVLVERCLAMSSLRLAWRYRLAFILPFLLFSMSWLLIQIASSRANPNGWFLIAAGGGFLGALLSTGLNISLWENNFPPSLQVMEDVFQRHRSAIGEPALSPTGKRIFDILLSFGGIIFSAPLWLIMTFLLWIEDPGPILFVKNSVGKGGRNFHQYKFRTMVTSAELHTGPVLASEGDERVLVMGRLLRKTALDELPQLINILKGEMSFVGPRPQRTVLVFGYLENIPGYAERHRVLPGLSGLAQVAGDYYLTPRQKLRFDRLYIRYASLGFDLKLLYLAFLITFWYRWQRGWNGRLPRRLLHSSK